MKKYIFTGETKVVNEITLHRIVAVRNFSNVYKGDLGGWIESEENLSHDYNAWVYDDAQVYGNAKICGNAKISGNAKVYENTKVYGNAQVYGNATVYGNAWVYGYAKVCSGAHVYDDAEVYENADVYGNADVYETAKVYGNAKVCGNSNIYGSTDVYGDAKIFYDAKVSNNTDYIVFKNFWSSGRYFTWTRSNNMWSVGCFYGTGEELIKKAYADSEKSGIEYERVVRYVESILADKQKTKHKFLYKILRFIYKVLYA